jgi:two-component system sensor kinase FixL
MDTMASTLAHELNQPLTAVANYIRGCRRLLASGGDPAQIGEALLLAESSAQRAGEIVRRVRAFVSRGAVSASAQDLPDLVKHACVLALLDQQVRGVSHEFRFDPGAKWVMADAIQVQQVVINLVRNAVEAMESSPRRHITLSTRLDGNFVEVAIADTGPGIGEDVREALFSPFQSSKSEGVGIGLSICRTIVEAHQGTIRADEADEGGTVFRFTLPKADPGRKKERAAKARSS